MVGTRITHKASRKRPATQTSILDRMMKEKFLSLFALMSLGLSPLALADNKLCPIMIEDETDEGRGRRIRGEESALLLWDLCQTLESVSQILH